MPPQKPFILCAVRGRPESRKTVTHAINLALEMDARLLFFHVIDAEFLGSSAIGSPLRLMYQELREMSTFAMLILCDRAQRRGVQDVDFVIWEGDIKEKLRQAAAETHARLLVIGRPTPTPGSNIFKEKEFEAFIAELSASVGVEIVVAGD